MSVDPSIAPFKEINWAASKKKNAIEFHTNFHFKNYKNTLKDNGLE